MSTPNQRPPHDPSPWWRHRMMWLVVGGPAVVVVAAIATGIIAARGADVVIHQDDTPDRVTLPAEQGRNHAASPNLPNVQKR
jgi:uncharacterized protein